MVTCRYVLTTTSSATTSSTWRYALKYRQKRPSVARTAWGLLASCRNMESRWPIIALALPSHLACGCMPWECPQDVLGMTALQGRPVAVGDHRASPAVSGPAAAGASGAASSTSCEL